MASEHTPSSDNKLQLEIQRSLPTVPDEEFKQLAEKMNKTVLNESNLMQFSILAMELIEPHNLTGSQKKAWVLGAIGKLIMTNPLFPDDASRRKVRGTLFTVIPDIIDVLISAAKGKFHFGSAVSEVVEVANATHCCTIL